ncbi:heavy metal translocating P-type ATPase [Rhodopirellula sp. JC740]|uniref:Heavy metal translocating P-type ATPase n=1 Tax=Rhodopirellula halodulae TaxID=2894198 RepID=A0ABS8NDK1_9BACT|nr:heavy metal translocating P-type ATPase metal-binding domain-containing protein [Rhodopirellula sp. JC740]MCC9641484.1 heavy metal translocating P-type ATPase [Rhodopirellula sp. JC740]
MSSPLGSINPISSADNDIQTLPCIHCGEPTEVAMDTDPQVVFCCNGCRGAYELIHGWGLENYYGLRDQLSGASQPVDRNGQSVSEASLAERYAVFDRAEYLGRSEPKEQSDGTMVCELAVHGLHCAACAWLIENVATRTPGWLDARVKMSEHTMRVVFDPKTISLSRIAQPLDRLGYELSPLPEHREDHFRQENQRLLIQIAFAGFCAANAMWIAIALYAGEASDVEESHWSFLRWVGTGLGLAAVAFPGRTFFQGAWASIKTRTPHMDLPVALGLAVGTIAGVVAAISGRGESYFDSLAVLVFLLLIGRWIQFRQQHRAAKAVDLLLRITPRHANRIQFDGQTELVLVDNLRVGDHVRVMAGQSVPVDGVVLSGASSVDQSLLTGESLPVPVKTDSPVSAGTVNLQSPLDIRVESIGRDSRIGQVMQTVEEATSKKIPIVQLADRIGGYFVVIVTLLACLTFACWFSEGLGTAASRATSLLIVACPCALALATPLAIAVALGRAAKRKILIRDGSSLQSLATTGKIWFDKTGTLTEGRPRAEHVHGDQQAIGIAAAIERECQHPIARAIAKEAERLNISQPTDASLQQVHAGGVSGRCEGSTVLVGNVAFMKMEGVHLPTAIIDACDRCTQQGASPNIIAVDGVATCVLAVRDPLKPKVARFIDSLRQQGWDVGILSGDHVKIVEGVASQLGIAKTSALGGLTPEDKLRQIQADQSVADGRSSPSVVMVGDGANDAAALAAADVGIAVRGGAEVSLQAAPIYVATDEMNAIENLMHAADRTQRLIHTTFAASLSYNVIAVILAMTGHISPLTAAILMPISSVTVLALTLAWPVFPKIKP